MRREGREGSSGREGGEPSSVELSHDGKKNAKGLKKKCVITEVVSRTGSTHAESLRQKREGVGFFRRKTGASIAENSRKERSGEKAGKGRAPEDTHSFGQVDPSTRREE